MRIFGLHKVSVTWSYTPECGYMPIGLECARRSVVVDSAYPVIFSLSKGMVGRFMLGLPDSDATIAEIRSILAGTPQSQHGRLCTGPDQRNPYQLNIPQEQLGTAQVGSRTCGLSVLIATYPRRAGVNLTALEQEAPEDGPPRDPSGRAHNHTPNASRGDLPPVNLAVHACFNIWEFWWSRIIIISLRPFLLVRPRPISISPSLALSPSQLFPDR